MLTLCETNLKQELSSNSIMKQSSNQTTLKRTINHQLKHDFQSFGVPTNKTLHKKISLLQPIDLQIMNLITSHIQKHLLSCQSLDLLLFRSQVQVRRKGFMEQRIQIILLIQMMNHMEIILKSSSSLLTLKNSSKLSKFKKMIAKEKKTLKSKS